MYCVKCGVELEDGVKRCPLCETAVPEIKGLEEEFAREYPIVNINLYEMKMKKVKKAVFLSFFTISIISILEVFFSKSDNVWETGMGILCDSIYFSL